MTLEELVVEMARQAITDHGSDRRTRAGKPMRSASYPVDHVLVKLPPSRQLSLARREFSLPREVDGVPLKVSEKPSVLNKPTGRWIISTMCQYIRDDGRVSGSVGRGCLDNDEGME